MKRHYHYRFLSTRSLLVLVAAIASAAVLPGCREKRPAGQTIKRGELETIINATSRADNLTKALESKFAGRGYSFRVAFSSSGTGSNVVETLSGGPSSLSVYGAQSFDEAIELDRDIHGLFDEEELTGIEILYEVQIDSKRDIPTMYPASTLAESAEFFAEIKKRQQSGAGQSAIRSEADSEGGDKPQPKAEGRSR